MADPEAPIGVLVVSGDDAILEDARFGFPADTRVLTAPDARAAHKVLEEFHPAVVVVDLTTGSAGGFSLARDMSQIASQRDIPVLILLEREQDSWLAGQAGAAMYRTKPITAESLAADALSLVS